MHLAEDVWNNEVIFAKVKAIGYMGETFHGTLLYPAQT